MSETGPQKRYGLFIFAILLLLLGVAGVLLGRHNFAIRTVGVVACTISVYLARISNVRMRRTLANGTDRGPDSKAKARPGE